MTDTYYTVRVTVGEYTWHLVRAAVQGSEISDGTVVLDNLTFGWAMPDQALWPVQPNPMTATFAINVPEFPVLDDIDEGWAVAIEVGFEDGAHHPTFAFYGRATDLVAVPRSRHRTGVTISCAAVDYTVDPNELSNYATADESAMAENSLLAAMWTELGLGYDGMGPLPTWPLTPVADVAQPGPSGTPARALIDAVLLQAVDGGPSARAIFAPYIDSAGLLQHGADDPDFPKFVFDVLEKIPDTDNALHIAAGKVGRSIQWGRRKRRAQPTRIETTGTVGTTPQAAEVLTDFRPIVEQVDTISADNDRLLAVAEFYLPDAPSRGWQVEGVRWLFSHESTELVTDLLALDDIMPRWALAEGASERASCYRKSVVIEGLPSHQNPYYDPDDPATNDLRGVLTGVQLTIAGGEVYLDLKLRQTEPIVTPEDG